MKPSSIHKGVHNIAHEMDVMDPSTLRSSSTGYTTPAENAVNTCRACTHICEEDVDEPPESGIGW
jgi:hypothetical protein